MLGPLEMSDLVSLCSVLVAAMALAFNMLKSYRQNSQSDALTQSQLKNISEVLAEIKSDVKDIQRKVDSHATRITALEVRVANLDERLSRMEEEKIGGTS